ncbi:uncharacterized protein LOC106881363 [Octopus bimaculoides]|uniref:CUB domain-containing protein n=1 Tax=Octopus bimaculoides TaxID=37653 RepID=A0A0L8I819_OCTBM|nr:uncharacterized protein LOC106881363 [Octopus bimaculoides]|eukprot:XP_014787210.1 PREDICTED: uncharacterized protein LOC106881363 [Octopus bimaculoides]
MMLEELKHLLNFLCFIFILFHCCNAERIIDMESYDCVHTEPFQVSDNDLMRIRAQPRHDRGDRFKCKITLQALQTKFFYVYIADIDIKECGVTLKFYDYYYNRQNMIKELSCKTTPGAYFQSRSNILIVELDKLTSSNTVYRFSIVAATNHGPKIDRTSGSPSLKTYSILRIFILILVYVSLH